MRPIRARFELQEGPLDAADAPASAQRRGARHPADAATARDTTARGAPAPTAEPNAGRFGLRRP